MLCPPNKKTSSRSGRWYVRRGHGKKQSCWININTSQLRRWTSNIMRSFQRVFEEPSSSQSFFLAAVLSLTLATVIQADFSRQRYVIQPKVRNFTGYKGSCNYSHYRSSMCSCLATLICCRLRNCVLKPLQITPHLSQRSNSLSKTVKRRNLHLHQGYQYNKYEIGLQQKYTTMKGSENATVRKVSAC